VSGRGKPCPTTDATSATVGDIVGAYKSLVANGCLELFKVENRKMGKLWQRNYHEHIIRHADSHSKIADYIFSNPAKWHNDLLYVS
jgi:REP element-mobilizing transposase RayT